MDQSITSKANPFSFKGRIGRQTFWLTFIVIIVASFLTGIVIGAAGPEAGRVIYFLVMPFFIWIGLAMQVKRWHDRDHSGWCVLINLVPFLGPIVSLIDLGLRKGSEGPNKYGDDPIASQ